MPPILEMRRVSVLRGEQRVLRDVTMTLPAGQHTAILGPNGAGKTTLLKLLTREVYPLQRTDSYLRLFGQDRWNVWDLRARIGVVSHELQRAYSDHVRGIDVVLSGFYWSIGTWPHQHFGEAQRARALEVMRMFAIEHLANQRFGDMSTGEQRRCLLARALVHDPEVLILDEPTNGLDLAARFRFLALIRELIRRGKTVILVTHRVDEIVPEISYVVLLKDGTVLASGPKHQMLTSDRVSRLFGVPLTVVHANGYYQVVPAA